MGLWGMVGVDLLFFGKVKILDGGRRSEGVGRREGGREGGRNGGRDGGREGGREEGVLCFY